MNKILLPSSKKGFTLLEMTVVLVIITVLTSAVIPALTQNFINQAGQKVAMDINNIQNAALAYYVKNSAWPNSITPTGVTPSTDLESNGFLPAGWNAVNPFGSPYSISNSGSFLTVSTQVADGTQSTIINQLPTSSQQTGNAVSSSVPVPGVTATGFGQWQSASFNTTYQAPSDGFIVGFATQNTGNTIYTLYTDSNPSPSTVRQIGYGTSQHINTIDFTCPVRKGDYWKVTSNGIGPIALYFIGG